MSKLIQLLCGLMVLGAGIGAVTPAAATTSGWDGCNRSEYGVHCETSAGYTTAILGIRYETGLVEASSSNYGHAWLDGSNDGGNTWDTLGTTANYAVNYNVYRACTTDWLVTYVCTSWAN